MKKFLKNAGLRIGVFALAIGAAFATNAMKNSNFAVEDGYQPLDTEGVTCIKRAECTDILGPVCTWKDPVTNISHELFGMEENNGQTVCTKRLYRIQ
ncbi:DUF6520 family protein [Gelidibacter japonicus]|uniref:DUF6520 family protein n=1 Tax=Gelidibacter japonicus TaxID=1962232 RepID=UPI0013D0BFDB|nr:DUF6520 family protein [Gelidibacter japonicus]